MATVYSLVCWGGLTGKTVSISATTDVVTLIDHGLRDGAKLWSSGTLPVELSVLTPVYARSTGANTFTLHTSAADAIANTGQILFAGSSTYAAVTLKSDIVASPATALADYGLSDLSRWGVSGSERIYNSLYSLLITRSSASLSTDDEVYEIFDNFDDIRSNGLSTAGNNAYSIAIHTKVNGKRTPAFHGGVPGAGYRFLFSGTTANGFSPNSYSVTLDGVELAYTSASSSSYSLYAGGSLTAYATIRNCIINNIGGGNIYGLRVDSSVTAHHNLIINHKGSSLAGLYIASGIGSYVYNNTVSGCDVGVRAAANSQGIFYNNLSVLNTVNWTGSPAFVTLRAASNIGTLADTCTFTAAAGTQNLTTSVTTPVLTNSRVWLTTTGILPTVGGAELRTDIPYFVNSIAGTTVKLSTTYGGSALTFDGVGTGAHTLHWVWSTSGTPANYIDTSNPSTVFVDYTNNDYRPAGSGATPAAEARMVDAGATIAGLYLSTDIADAESPNYNNGGSEAIDVGCFEFDHGYGLHPSTDARGLAFTGLLAGSKVKVFITGTDIEKFSVTSSAVNETWSESVSGSLTVDYVILKAGYLPIRVVGITVTTGSSGIQSIPVSQVAARWYQTASGLTLNTDVFANASTKKFGLSTGSTVQNLASYLFDQWLELGDSGEDYANKPFPLEANGPNSFTWLDGWEADLSAYPNTISNLSRDGMRYLDTTGAMTASWCALLSVGVPSGLQVRYQQIEGATPTNAATTGNIDQLIQIYGDSTHGNFDYRGYMVAKVQAEGYDQAEVDVVGQYGTLEDQLYVIALIPVANGVAAANPTVSSVTITDHAGSPVTWNSKVFSITITDSGTTSGQTILQWIRHAFSVGGTFQGKDGFNWHDLIQTNGNKFKGIRGNLYGGVGATLKGVRVLRGTDPHPDFTLHTADDGTTVDTTPPEAALGTVSGIVVGSRLQVYNVTTATEMYNAVTSGDTYNTSYTNGTGYTSGDVVRVRLTYCSGLSAKLPVEYFTVAASSGWSILASQVDDDIYIANGIDGSTVTEYYSDYVNVQIDISDPDNITTIQRGYAWYCYQMTLIDGIRYFFDAFIAEDAYNYLLNTDVADIKIQNTGTVGVTLTGGALRRKDGSSPIAAGGSVYIYYGRAYSDVVTVSGSNVVTGDLADIAPAVWGHGTRTLTSGSTGGATADEVWSHGKALSVGKFLGLK